MTFFQIKKLLFYAILISLMSKVSKVKTYSYLSSNLNKSGKELLRHSLFSAHSREKRALTKQDLSLSIVVSAPHLFSVLTSVLLDECLFFFSLLSFHFSLLIFLVISTYLFSEALGDFMKYFRVFRKAVGCLKFTVSLSDLL